MKKPLGVAAAAAALALTMSACGGSDSGSAANGEINYWLWDANQLPAYQQCADDFTKANPDIKVKITQRGWDDYWTTLTNGFVAGTAPDVFTNHLSKYPEFAAKKQLLPLDEAVEKDGINLDAYTAGLPELWVGQDGKRYGLPKDWDTVGLFYNKAMTDAAGIPAEQMANLDWNPKDGGSYEKVIAKLTVDKNGKRGDEPGFDKDNVATYGLGLTGSGAGQGQTEWSFLTATTGWTATDKNPWGSKFNYDDPRFQETITWWAGLTEKGYMPKLETTVGASMPDSFGAGKAAINSNGDWLIGQYKTYKGIETAIAPTPKGPNGQRASMFNGLADSVWAGTKNPAASVKWAEYLGSAACQDVVAGKAVVFPAISSSAEIAAKAFADKGIDVSAFTTHVKDGTTFLFPIADKAAKVDGIMKPAMDAVLSGKKPASSLTEANNQVNDLFK
ncbi:MULTISPECIES: sugar ABC transporter substrate-binding protein [Paenarthrobacter]|uniref:Sugar ABC transporter substrate-binding protein n=1 Tax=Paenarthrobacter ureafaciens TaxID=37931 RepID=A0AAX3EFP0_PAEUR|nr:MULTISPECIES: sugar ABC transporter substrate-binding protein [Paenarthrobacter]NKR11781.1 ABC transporter substrate-binding protein [Arthrobacter sp. M5]NKR16874.1 ABC transporter substrate-binding protein [Arthrobacter sp. M6]OEH60515.1 ABC transporter substrate-binding protein [Arthrobacter sp. D4]OEH61130.1 ABC transporter substrate-binding protein [Arthrobacter sp. D2]MDO5866073.1 sugar ABC transporter substrate-binding protein [Paenarthrobacter sp. SD-2]